MSRGSRRWVTTLTAWLDRRTGPEAALQIDDLRIKALLARLPMAVAAVRWDGRICYLNARATQASGYTHEDLPTLAHWRARAFPDPQYRAQVTQRWDESVARAAASGSDIAPQEAAPTTKWGERRYVTVFGLVLQGGFLTFFFDHTDRELSEIGRIASEQRFQDVVDAAGEYVWECDLEDRYTYLSDKVTSICGYLPAEMLGRKPREFMPDGEFADVARRIRALKHEDGSFRGLEHRSITKNGVVFWQLVSSVTVRDGTGRVIAFRGTGMDITERKRAEQQRELLESQVREAQKLQAVGTLAGGIAHEFNNLLAVIMGHAAMLKRESAEPTVARESVDAIADAAQQARQLVQQILLFGRRQALDITALNLATVAQEALRLLAPTFPAGVTLQCSFSPQAPQISGDRGQLTQLALNLCMNALYAMRDKRGELRVSLAPANVDEGAAAQHRDLRAGHYAVLAVQDQGCGIDAATLSRIFEPFFTTKPVGEGTGLGLAVVDGIVRSHGGTVAVSSEVGRGTCFEVYLPAAGTPAVDGTAPSH